MATVFAFLWLMSNVAFVLAMISPGTMVFWSKNKTRAMGSLYLAAAAVFIICFGIASPSSVKAPAAGAPVSDAVSKASSRSSLKEVSSVTSSETASQTSSAVSSAASEASKASSESAQDQTARSQTVSGSITVTAAPGTVAAGSNASLAIKGRPNTEYSISVYYSSGASKANGLAAAMSDGSGSVSWTWKVSAKTTPGTHRIVISGGDDNIETSFTTT